MNFKNSFVDSFNFRQSAEKNYVKHVKLVYFNFSFFHIFAVFFAQITKYLSPACIVGR